ncbi:SDR family NAD(P)-dependent oxidoreductase [Modestobacter sp. VKM Ac-2978]|uniref:SDR family NAD(P)-dependent oxidoreductase n=1 Tax=Modestobacter sp. VKM Ac-2978 TaxID=3004132 RepID=UPI0022AA2AF0|nr:SDR family NAD(P)-dependent oxidoreductase [Modestobacter sp. VKM Ac-2978]MCZ2850545.1 SDR family NAD(P)-dependent oxidoreductase [Modestobacter sp. VKM Ac-2978]
MRTDARIRTDFDAASTADDVVAGRDLTGTAAIVTGASSGLGIETARSLARAGSAVTLAVRDSARGRVAAEDIIRTTGNRDVTVAVVELTDGASIQRFVDNWNRPLHYLINNAAVMGSPLARTTEGWEMHFGTNHLGHFRLALQLRDALARGASAHGESRIVALTSTAHVMSPVVFDDVHYGARPYDPMAAYGQSKTANALFAVEATRRWRDDGIVANSVNPGAISTGLQRHLTHEQAAEFDRLEEAGTFSYKTAQQGAASTLVAALAPEFGVHGGHYVEDGQEATDLPDDDTTAPPGQGVRRWATDPDAAARLWDLSLNQIAGVS